MAHMLRLASAGILVALAVAAPAGAAGSGSNPPPTGETLNGSSTEGGFTSTISCQNVGNGTGSYTMSGTAAGPYPGTFTESGTIVLTNGAVTSFDAHYTIASGLTTITGSKSGPVTFRGTAQCDAPSPDFGTGTNFFHAGPFDAAYGMTVSGPLGTNTFTGTVQNDINFTSGLVVSAGMQEVFLAPDEPLPPPVCKVIGDKDHDGLIDSREGLYGGLAGVADTNHNGVKDGNEDVNHNGVSDEDEDDGHDPCALDGNHNGRDDEDEDD
jgi:hypothetical protein